MISPYAKQGYIDHQTLSFDAYLKFIENDFLGGGERRSAAQRQSDEHAMHERRAIVHVAILVSGMVAAEHVDPRERRSRDSARLKSA